jgi:hypothetical protein
MIEESSNIVNEERIEQFGNFLFIGEVEGAFEGNPALVSIAQLVTLKYR